MRCAKRSNSTTRYSPVPGTPSYWRPLRSTAKRSPFSADSMKPSRLTVTPLRPFLAVDALHEEHALGIRRLAEHTGRHARDLLAILEVLPELLRTLVGPRREKQREQGHEEHDRRGEREHRPDPRQERDPGGRPNDHLGVPIAPRYRDQNRDKQRQREQHRQVVERGEADESDDRIGRDPAAGRAREHPHELAGHHEREQHRERGGGVAAELAQQGALEDHSRTNSPRPFDAALSDRG